MRKEELTKKRGNIDRKDAFSLVATGPKASLTQRTEGDKIMQKFTPNDFLNIAHIVQLNNEMQSLAALRNEVIGGNTNMGTIDTSAGVFTVPTPEFVNVIESNLEVLSAGVDVGIEPRKTWLGEDRDVVRLDYRDVNRWLDSLRILRIHFEGMGSV